MGAERPLPGEAGSTGAPPPDAGRADELSHQEAADTAAAFGPELYNRLRWFVQLRWAAVVGLAAASILGGGLRLAAVWPSLLIVAVAVAVGNLVVAWRLRHRLSPSHPPRSLRVHAMYQVAMDLAALMVTVHFTGGLESPLLPFFVFHMVIGTMILASELMYLVALATCWGTVCLYLLEEWGVLATWPVDPGRPPSGLTSGLNLLTLIVTLFGAVYLTDSVMRRFTRRSLQLYATTRALAEHSAEQARLLREIQRVERRKSHYMRISAHQLRSPLGTIRTSLDVLLGGWVEPASERGRRLLEGVGLRVEGLLAIVNDLLELAKVREGSGRAPWTRGVLLNQLLVDVLDALGQLADERGVALESRVEDTAVLEEGVAPDLVMALQNLVQNAIKYSHRGGHVRVTLRTRAGRALVEVADDGIGIPPEHLDDVFMEFVRAPNARHHAAEGTGLGLALVQEVARVHGGEVTVASADQGTTFILQLPLCRPGDHSRVTTL